MLGSGKGGRVELALLESFGEGKSRTQHKPRYPSFLPPTHCSVLRAK